MDKTRIELGPKHEQKKKKKTSSDLVISIKEKTC